MPNALANYFRDMRDTRATGAAVKEESYYGALQRLFDAYGAGLRPRVRLVLQLANRGAGKPDGGLFTESQFQRTADEPIPGQPPERGAVEVKSPGEDAFVTADGSQVSRYWRHYGLVLVTNYRDFVLVGRDDAGKPVRRETYRLAADETDFWRRCRDARAFAAEHEVRFGEFLKRVMLHAAPLASAVDVAWFLASYARDALARIEAADLPALTTTRKALEDALGLQFEDEKGEHFFRSTLVQTLFYGVFSAWVLWHRERPPGRGDRFDWHAAGWTLHVPMIRSLFHRIADPATLRPLGLTEPLNRAADTLNRVDRKAFFAEFDAGDAVQYFYEPFLRQFDPALRKALGVWYTPREVVTYMVERVDAVLRSELNLPDGLADPRVYVLDPCCGTGAYLVAVLDRIARTLADRGEDALAAQDLKQAATSRVFGFELLPAPYVVAHLQLGLLLANRGAPLAEETERAAVYLTNALTGWEPPKGVKQTPAFREWPEFRDEKEAAENVKREQPILVILGNPPYNAFAGVSPEEEAGLVEPYKRNLNAPVSKGGWGIRKFNLDDLYVRFFRLAERRIAEKTGRGVVCYISNFSYLSDPSFVVMRQRFLQEFDAVWIDCLNGDSRETGKKTPDGKPDPSVFSTDYERVGIRVGTAIGLMVRRDQRAKSPAVRYRDFWGVTKRTDLLASLDDDSPAPQYEPAHPTEENRFSFRPGNVAEEYAAWPRLADLCGVQPLNGLMEKRGGALIDMDREALEARMRAYYDRNVAWEELKSYHPGLTTDAARFPAENARKKVLDSELFDAARLRRYVVRPFDDRWAFYSGVRPLWNEPRPALWHQCWDGNAFLMSRPSGVANPEGVPFFFTRQLGDNDFLRGHAYFFPFRLKRVERDKAQRTLEEPEANLSAEVRRYLAVLNVADPDDDSDTAALVWLHALAVGYSPAYLAEHADGLKQDWPRVPLPADRDRLIASASLGRRVAALLDSATPVAGVTAGKPEPAFKTIGVLRRLDGKPIDPGKGHLDVTAGWGYAGREGVTMPGKGRTEVRLLPADERAAFGDAAERGGPDTLDVYLNDETYWANVPRSVWEFTIGGYQVLKKWLSYREKAGLGRGLTTDEAREVTATARRLAALVLLRPELDANYRATAESSVAWPLT